MELSAKLNAVIIQHWRPLTTCWEDAGISLIKATRLICERPPPRVAALLVVSLRSTTGYFCTATGSLRSHSFAFEPGS